MAPPRVERRAPKARDRIEVDVPGKGQHPAVVLHVEEGMIIVAVCSTTPIDDTEIFGATVDREPALSQMRLRPGSVTRFYECHIQPMEWAGGVFDIWGRCQGGRFDKLFAAMEKTARESLAGTRTIACIPRNALSLVGRLQALVASTSSESPAVTSSHVANSSAELGDSSKPSQDR